MDTSDDCLHASLGELLSSFRAALVALVYALEFAAYGECNAYEAWAGYESGRYTQCY